MAKWEDYVITKVSYNQEGNRIEAAFVYDDYENHIDNGELRDRNWLVAEVLKGKRFCTADKREGGWFRINAVSYVNGGFTLGCKLPQAIS